MVRVDLFKKLHYYDLEVKLEMDREVLVIQGESGAGKTTILDILAGIRQPDRGEILLEDKVVFSSAQGVNLPIRNRDIGYVFQNYALFPHLTVRENIRFGIESRRSGDFAYSDYITEVMKIKHLQNRYPSQLSGGEKQRVALARALAVRPRLLLLDEPFSALDGNTRRVIYEEFLEFKNLWQLDMILITHNNEEAALLGDRILRIREGVLV